MTSVLRRVWGSPSVRSGSSIVVILLSLLALSVPANAVQVHQASPALIAPLREAPAGPSSVISAIHSSVLSSLPFPTTLGHHASLSRPTGGASSKVPFAGPLAASVSTITAWDGINNLTANCGCIPPDGSIGEGDGYVVQSVNSEIAVWTTGGVLQYSNALSSFFNIPATCPVYGKGDTACATFPSDPQVVFDNQSQRWFTTILQVNESYSAAKGSVGDVRGTILLNVSTTVSPLGSWMEYQFGPGSFGGPGAGTLPDQPFFAVNGINVILAADDFPSSGKGTTGAGYDGAQVWALNKSSALTGSEVVWSTHWTTTTTNYYRIVPVRPWDIGSTKTGYLVTDCNAGCVFSAGWTTSTVDLFTLTGSPPGAVNFPSPAALTMNAERAVPYSWGAPQDNAPITANGDPTPVYVAINDGSFLTGVVQGNMLWTGGANGCLVSAVLESCLRLVEVNVSSSQVVQDFDWNQGVIAGGPQTDYDYYPSIQMGSAGNLMVTYSNSSNSTFPSVMITTQNTTDPANTLAAPVLLKAGSGPDAPPTFITGASPYCGPNTPVPPPGTGTYNNPCRYGDYFGTAVDQTNSCDIWIESEYGGSDWATNNWHTWVAKTQAQCPVRTPVSFLASGMPSGTSWTVTLNGVPASSTGTNITFNMTGGVYSYSIATPVAGAVGIRYVDSTPTGSVTVGTSPISISVVYSAQFHLSTALTPAGSGTVTPASGWETNHSSVVLSATPNPGYLFSSWAGNGTGNYSGTSDPYTLTMTGPVTEIADFVSETVSVSTPTANRSTIGETSYALCFNANFTSNAPSPFYTNWTWGDGTKTSGSSSTSPVSACHTFTSAGVFAVSVFVNTSGGLRTGQSTVTVTVYQHVQASFTTSLMNAVVPANETFSNTSSYGYGVYNLTWNFGDGNTSFSAVPPYQIYYKPGIYTVTLAVRDALGYSSTVSESFTVWGSASFTIQLAAGWNLVGDPLVQNSYTLYELSYLLGSSFVSMQMLSGGVPTNYSLSTPTNVNNSVVLAPGYGLWVDLSLARSLTLYGNDSASLANVALGGGWTGVGWSVTASENASSLAASLTGCTAISIWDANSQSWDTYIVGFSPSVYDFTVTQGMGVYVWTPSSGTFSEP